MVEEQQCGSNGTAGKFTSGVPKQIGRCGMVFVLMIPRFSRISPSPRRSQIDYAQAGATPRIENQSADEAILFAASLSVSLGLCSGEGSDDSLVTSGRDAMAVYIALDSDIDFAVFEDLNLEGSSLVTIIMEVTCSMSET